MGLLYHLWVVRIYIRVSNVDGCSSAVTIHCSLALEKDDGDMLDVEATFFDDRKPYCGEGDSIMARLSIIRAMAAASTALSICTTNETKMNRSKCQVLSCSIQKFELNI